ncbi:VTC domain-containing protein [Butyrivibrio sp. AE2032]|uniref:VTC domain-containing protein n=1 Tax=Butyrivibrio sp. AE2032 TaxID=1458463 RepID=UPI00068D52A5|nr:VTC domain-containing protein [Butyrivibrio sp. AE2032]
MKYRHELKHDITTSDMIAIRQRLLAVAKADSHAIDGKYLIRSLYFDTPNDKALYEKQDGVSRRNKFRIRYYNGDNGMSTFRR